MTEFGYNEKQPGLFGQLINGIIIAVGVIAIVIFGSIAAAVLWIRDNRREKC